MEIICRKNKELINQTDVNKITNEALYYGIDVIKITNEELYYGIVIKTIK